MGIDGPTFVPKVDNFTNLGQGLSQKLAFSEFFSQFYDLNFLTKFLPLSNKESTFALVFSFFDCCIFTILLKYYSKFSFLTRRHLELP